MKQVHLNRKLVLETPQRVADGAGGFSENWAVAGTLWAELRSRSGAVRSVSGSTVSRVSYRVVVRAAPVGSDMRPRAGQRFRAGARVFAIRAVSDLESAGRYLVCFADEEVVA